MIARRGLLGLLLGTPVLAAGGIVSGATEVAPPSPVAMNNGRRRWQKIVNRLQREQDHRYEAARYPENQHVSVRTKKSWSPAFKAHVEGQIRRERIDWWNMSEEETIAELRRRGFTKLKDFVGE